MIQKVILNNFESENQRNLSDTQKYMAGKYLIKGL